MPDLSVKVALVTGASRGVSAGVCFLAAGLSFGLLANASLRN